MIKTETSEICLIFHNQKQNKSKYKNKLDLFNFKDLPKTSTGGVLFFKVGGVGYRPISIFDVGLSTLFDS